MDMDGEVFSHVLHYLRHGGVFPLFYSASKGHDYALYNAVRMQARIFELSELERWIEDKRYLEVVRTTVSAEELEDLATIARTIDTDTNIEYRRVWKANYIYLCPQRIPGHKGNFPACGKQCNKARKGRKHEYQDEGSWKVVAVERKTTFHPELYDDTGTGKGDDSAATGEGKDNTGTAECGNDTATGEGNDGTVTGDSNSATTGEGEDNTGTAECDDGTATGDGDGTAPVESDNGTGTADGDDDTEGPDAAAPSAHE